MKFVDITQENWTECVALTDKDDIYIASNLYSIAEAQFYNKAQSKAIVVDNKMVGYTLFGEDEDESTVFFIDRFMISKNYRCKGLGALAMQKLVELGFILGYIKIETSTSSKNLSMQKFLEKNGFKTDGEIRDKELVYYRK